MPSGAQERKSKARERWEAEEEETAEEAAEEEGPVEEPAAEAGEAPAAARPTVVVVDHELSPSQARNLERATGAQVLDRTGVIVEIFHRHARSREAKLQVEIARLNYVAPRLRESTGKPRARSTARAPASRRSSSIAARSATASPSCARSSRPSSRTRITGATPGGTSSGWRWSATPTPASPR